MVGWVRQAARITGANPTALLATALQESGAQLGKVGDQGTSFGPFQFHIGGALGSHPPAWANTYQAVLNRAQEFKRLGVQGGVGAAAVQRPANPGAYAQGVNAKLAQAEQILGQTGGLGALSAPPSRGPGRSLQSAAPGSAGASRVNPRQIAVNNIASLLNIPRLTLPLLPAAGAAPKLTAAPRPGPGLGLPTSGVPQRGIETRANYAGTDMGVDFRGAGIVPAHGDAVVTHVSTTSGWPGGGLVVYKLTSGPARGRYVYVAENITPAVRVGQRIRAGQPVAQARGGYPYVETGWAADPRGTTLALAQKSGYIPNQREFPTPQGKAYAGFIGLGR